MSKKLTVIKSDELNKAMEQLLHAVVETACKQFKGKEAPAQAIVQMCDEILLSVIRRMINTYFASMLNVINAIKKGGE